MVKLCIFDLDGTLLYTLASIRFHLNKTLREFSLPEITRGECESFIGNGAARLVARAAAKGGIVDKDILENILSAYNRSYDDAPIPYTFAYDGVSKMLESLKNSGCKLAVLTNKPEPTAVKLVRHFFGDSFDIVYGGKEGRILKPAPDTALSICKELGILPSETAFIGDSSVDIHTGKNMGALSVGVSWGFRRRGELVFAGADAVVDTALQVVEVCLGDGKC